MRRSRPCRGDRVDPRRWGTCRRVWLSIPPTDRQSGRVGRDAVMRQLLKRRTRTPASSRNDYLTSDEWLNNKEAQHVSNYSYSYVTVMLNVLYYGAVEIVTFVVVISIIIIIINNNIITTIIITSSIISRHQHSSSGAKFDPEPNRLLQCRLYRLATTQHHSAPGSHQRCCSSGSASQEV